MANTFLTISMITNEALFVLRNNLTFTKRINRQYDDRFGVEGAKIGTTLNVRKPPRYLGRTGPALSVEDVTESQVPVVLTTQFGVDINFTSQDLLLNIDQFSKRLIQPAVATIANKIDYDGLQLFSQIYNSVGTPGTTPNALLTYLLAGVNLDNEAAPMDGQRYICINPLMQATIVDNLKALFQSSTQIKEQYEKGQMGMAAGFEWYMDQNVGVQLTGSPTNAPVVDGANQSGSTINLRGFTNSSTADLQTGDVIQFAGVHSVNPQSRQSTGSLRNFVVTGGPYNATSGGKIASVQITPGIVVGGAFATVDASPADGAAMTFYGVGTGSFTPVSAVNSPAGLAFHRDFATLATADLPLPRGVDMAARAADPDLGISIRLVRAYDINTDKFPCRLDVLYGWAVLRPELACRVQG